MPQTLATEQNFLSCEQASKIAPRRDVWLNSAPCVKDCFADRTHFGLKNMSENIAMNQASPRQNGQSSALYTHALVLPTGSMPAHS